MIPNLPKQKIVDLVKFVYYEGGFASAVRNSNCELSTEDAEQMVLDFLETRTCDCYLGNAFCRCEPNRPDQ